MLKVIIADDELPIRQWLNYCLADRKDRVKVVGIASDGLQAYELALQEKPDVVIMDIRMPAMDGITAMKKIKEVQPQTEFIVLSNYAEFSYAKEAISCGAREYILKSELRKSELLATLEKIQENRVHRYLPRTETVQPAETGGKEAKKYNSDGSDNKKSIEKALNYIHEHFNEDVSLADVARQVYRSPEYFSRLFKEVTGENFSVYLINYRLHRAKKLLTDTDLKITDIAHLVGYQNASYFSRLYKKYMGVTPEDQRRKHNLKTK